MTDAVIYLRLSREDGLHSDESESIASQRLLLHQYARANGLFITAEYIDDGISGMRRDRPGFQALLSAIENGFVRTVLVKDLSRLSRDYLQIGSLLEHWLPMHGARLIAVSDSVDTALPSPSNDFSPIRALLNDWYARDISRKVRGALRARRNAGICTLATVPYGYRRSGGSLMIQDDRAETARMIFRRCIAGESCLAIADALNAQQIPAPRGRLWHDATVCRMLKNTVYRGELLLGTTEKQSYKHNGRRRLPADAAARIPVPAIVSAADFSAAQTALAVRGHRQKPRHWLAGRVFCAVCGSTMTVTGEPLRLICAGRRRGNGCTNPSCACAPLLAAVPMRLTESGFPDSPFLAEYAVERAAVSADTVSVQLRYAAPANHCNIAETLDTGRGKWYNGFSR